MTSVSAAAPATLGAPASSPASIPASPPAPVSAPADGDVSVGRVDRSVDRASRESSSRQRRERNLAKFKAKHADPVGSDDVDVTPPPGANAAADDEATAGPAAGEASAAEQIEPAALTEDPSTWPDFVTKAVDEARGAYEKVRTENTKFRDVGQTLLAQNKAIIKQRDFFRAQLEAAGVDVDPRDLKILEFETRAAQEEASQGRLQQQKRSQDEARQQQMVQRLRAQAADEAKKHNIDAEDLAMRWAAAVNQHRTLKAKGSEPTLSDVADEVVSLRAARQQRANAAVPQLATKTPSPSGTLVQKFPRTPEGLRASMRARGHDVDD